MPKRPIILFDVMETLVTEPFYTAMPAFFGMSFDELLATKHPTSWVEFEKGQITEDEYLDRFFRDGRPVDGNALRQCLRRSYRWLDGMEDLMEELKSAGYEMHALSNYSRWYELIDESLKLSRFLRWTFVSCLTGVRKPDRQAFLGAAATLEVEPAECLFIDDREENVDAARDVGMNAILKLDSVQLRHELVERTALRVSARRLRS
jgi:HAD superfamily hydrolase (TIGR01509 family)